MRKLICCLVVCCQLSVAVAQTVRVAAAADLRYALDEIVKAYQSENPGAQINVSFGSSGNAYQQILRGAPFDLYFSADRFYPDELNKKGLTKGAPQLYAYGRLVIWSKQIIVSRGVHTLNDPSIHRIAVANPAHAPYGQRAVECLKKWKLYDKLESKLVFGENISQAAQFTQTGNAQVGLLALSLALSPAMKAQGNYFLIDPQTHTPLEQAFVIIKKDKILPETYKFAAYIDSPKAKKILLSYGFEIPAKE